ncbi:hypothetical protein EDB84DRAFT_624041 [Lactarius hengduanensis]|nr:hypothetical protein EDB84DRAFT_624041 [Lactarius hengduanensis]
MTAQDLDPVSLAGVMLVTTLFNTFLFGVISQQLYAYSLSGLKVSMRIKIFVGVLYTVIAFQSIMLWQLAWCLFVADYGTARNFKARTWQVPVISGCQCILVLSANIFLADRVRALTRCRIKSAIIIALSIGAFGFGVAIAMLTWFGGLAPDGTFTHPQMIISAFWYGLQAIAECLVAYSLMRALLNTRTGIRKSDSVAYYLVRRVVQMGLFATMWAISGLVAFIFFPKVCSLFDVTAGSIYAHVIIDTLQSESRIRFREHMAKRSQCDVVLAAQSPSDTSRKGASISPGTAHSNVSVLSMTNLGLGLETTHQSTYRISKDNISEVECAPVGQPGVHYEFSYAHFLGDEF